MTYQSPIALRLLVPLLCLALLPSIASARGAQMDMADEPALGASAAFDANGRLWLVTVRGGHVLLRHSEDLGRSFSQPVQVNPVAETIYASGENRPKVATGPTGQIDVQWTEQPAPGWTGAIRFAHSIDGGRHFSAPIIVTQDPAKVTRGFDSLAIAGNGDIVVAWIDGRDAAKAKAAGRPYAGFAFYYTWSTDGGQTFAPERKLMDHSCECCRTALARQPDGKVAAFFRGVYNDNIRDHAFAVLHTDGHANHPERATFSNWRVAACPDQGPRLAIGANGVRHAVWYEASHGPAIWYGQLDPGHPPRRTLKLGGAGASHADVALEGKTVWVAWNQVSADGYALMLRVSHDGGAHFDAARAIASSKVAVGSPQLLERAGAAYVAWNTADGFRLLAIKEQ
ncbi:MAG TPA: sialidase family protein [Rhodanobacteraceae bacterium]|nr:sialidase family protein [Rhodanobacteraceae bacterium]